ncbi:MAG: branched-chain amino acid ABC transporter permease [Anaerolineae bacterium]|nr:branched-chain amino acid ABC transporter permease [Anaerolineae bacterium]
MNDAQPQPGSRLPAFINVRALERRWRRLSVTDLVVWGIGVVLLLFVFWRIVLTFGQGAYTLESFIKNVIFGLAQGSIYALIALGYTLVYGILFMINFAHGEVFMSGTYIGFFVIAAMEESGFLAEQTLLALLIVFAVGMLSSMAVAVTLERIAYRPLRKAPRLVPLITAIGASIFLQQAFRGLFGSSTKVYPHVHLYALPQLFPQLEDGKGMDLISGKYDVQFALLGNDVNLVVQPFIFVIFIVALLMMAGLYWYVQRTKAGKAMRAVAEDKDTAALMGINVDRVIVNTFAVGAALAGAAGVLFALYTYQVTHTMGFIPGLKAFTAAVLGGIGNIPGAMFGGFALGFTESVAPGLLSIPHQLKDVVAFSMLVLILIFRPTGIFGEVLSEKKA